ncbi:MAG TPA: hypothetical protein VK201_10200 [bacterium]|nr:hypothetical protein [bacterium]
MTHQLVDRGHLVSPVFSLVLEHALTPVDRFVPDRRRSVAIPQRSHAARDIAGIRFAIALYARGRPTTTRMAAPYAAPEADALRRRL